MKGIILAGGKGTRLYPLTLGVSKQLLPINSKPMVFYPLSTLMLAGIRDILVITMPADLPNFKRALGDGSQWGIQITYVEQPVARGLADAFIVGSNFIGADASVLILGDNFMFGHDLGRLVNTAIANNKGATVFGYEVKDPQRYGIVELTFDGRIPVSIEEKPEHPKSNFAVPGLYIYDSQVTEIASKLKPSPRGEIEITDVNKVYLKAGKLSVVQMGRGMAWLDAGTHESLLQASNFVAAIEERQGLMIACLEEIAYQQNWITKQQLETQAKRYHGNTYGDYLERLLVRT
jgi:glucose-1-phosphate thymidylyltransferase